MYNSKYLLAGLYRKTSLGSFIIDYFNLNIKELSILRYHDYIKEIQSLLPEKLLCFRLKYSDNEFDLQKQIGLYTIDSISKTIQNIDEISPEYSEIRLIGIHQTDFDGSIFQYFGTVIDCENYSDKTILKKVEELSKYRCEDKGKYVWRVKEPYAKYSVDGLPGIHELTCLYDLRQNRSD